VFFLLFYPKTDSMETNIDHNQDPENQPSIFEGIGDIDRYAYEAGIRKARNALFIAGAIMFVVDVIATLIQRDLITETYMWTVIGIDALILGIFIGLGLWTKKKPYTAIIIGLVIFCLIQIMAMIGDPSNIYKGIIVKIAVVAALISGIKNARKLQNLNRAGF